MRRLSCLTAVVVLVAGLYAGTTHQPTRTTSAMVAVERPTAPAAVPPYREGYTPPTVTTTVATTTTTVPTTVAVARPPAPVAAPAKAVVPAAVTPARARTATPAPVSTGGGGIWACIIAHESGGNPGVVNPRSGAAGLVQFLPSTWHAMGMSGTASQYPASVQMAVAYRLQAQAGWWPWRGDGCTPVG